MSNVLTAMMKRNPPQTQEDCVRIAVRHALASMGPVEDRFIGSAARGLANGLFGPAFEAASEDQQTIWIEMCEREYRAAIKSAEAAE